MKIVFMGTPYFAVPTLKALNESKHIVSAVFSQPDKAVGRKQILTSPPVKAYATKVGIPVYQPTTLKDGSAFEIIKALKPDIIVVVAYGKILPKELLSFTEYGCINGHASLLPKYRGASPIQWCIVCGEKETGVTIQQMDEGIDTGDILSFEKTEIGENETAEELFERLAVVTADLMLKTVDALESGSVKPVKQGEGASHAPIITKEMAKIDFSKTAEEVHNAIRGYYSWPCAFYIHNNKRVKVIASRLGDSTDKKAGTVIGNTDELVVACGNGKAIRLITVQPEGSKPMSAKQMLCGNRLELGAVIGE